MTTPDPTPAAPVASVTPQVYEVDADGIVDFTKPRQRVRFRIDGDVFEAISAMPTLMAFELQPLVDGIADETLSDEQRLDIVTRIVNEMLLPESGQLFLSRLSSKTEPIDTDQFTDAIKYLFEHYTGRPTSSDSASSPQSDVPVPGSTSTAA